MSTKSTLPHFESSVKAVELAFVERRGEIIVGLRCSAPGCDDPITGAEPLLGEVHVNPRTGDAVAFHSRLRCLRQLKDQPECIRRGLRLDSENFLRGDQRGALQKAAERAGVAL